ncbi:MAG: hypothetical protein Q8L78_02075 [Coxiellaceae bacterium]|nr:hypothetical protein [Coxiellaceae bacterium]
MDISTAAALLSKSFLEAREAASLFDIEGSLQTAFLSDIEAMRTELLLDGRSISDPNKAFEAILKKYQELQITSEEILQDIIAKKSLKEMAVSSALQKIVSNTADYLFMPESDIPNLSDSLLEMITPLQDAKESLHSIASNSLGSVITDSVIPSVWGIAGSIIDESRHQTAVKKLEAQLSKVIESVENTYKKFQSAYANIANTYANALEKIKKSSPLDEALYEKTLLSWLNEERYLEQQITLQQERIAIVSAMLQEKQSARRMERMTTALSMVVSLSSLAGSPAVVAGMAIKLAIDTGCAVGNILIKESAELNHGIMQLRDILLISDDKSINDAKSILHRTQTPSIAFSGTLLELDKLLDVDLAKKGFQAVQFSETLVEKFADTLSQAFAKKAEGQSCCTYMPTTSLYYTLHFNPTTLSANFSTNPELKKLGKQIIQELIVKSKSLLAELILFEKTTDKLIKQNNPVIYMTNFDAFQSTLEQTLKKMQEQKSIILEHMGDHYKSNPKNDGMNALKELEILAEKIQSKLESLPTKKLYFDNAPHATFFKNGEPLNLSAITDIEKSHIVIAYSGNELAITHARNAFFNDIQLNIKAAETLLESVSKQQGKYIKNFGSALNALYIKLSLLSETEPASDKIKVAIATGCKALLALSDKAILQITIRLNYLNTHKKNYTPQQYQEALSMLQISLQEIKIFYQSIPNVTFPIKITQIENQMIQIKKGNLASLESALINAPTLMYTVGNVNNTTIKSTSRLFFGNCKHSEMENDITKKIMVLEKAGINKLQLAPLKPISEEMIVNCKADPSMLKKLIEGLKTEIQYVALFKEKCGRKIEIENLQALLQAYDQQCTLLRNICQKPLANEQKSGAFVWAKEQMQKLRGDYLKELEKSDTLLITLKESGPQLILPTQEIIVTTHPHPSTLL